MPNSFVPPQPVQPMPPKGNRERSDALPRMIGLITLGFTIVGDIALLAIYSSMDGPRNGIALATSMSIMIVPILSLIAAGIGALIFWVMKALGTPLTKPAAVGVGILLGLGSIVTLWSLYQSSI